MKPKIHQISKKQKEKVIEIAEHMLGIKNVQRLEMKHLSQEDKDILRDLQRWSEEKAKQWKEQILAIKEWGKKNKT